MKISVFLLLLLAGTAPAVLAQSPLRYTLWADGIVNVQLAKSDLYGTETGGRVEVSSPLRRSANQVFAQAGYTYFFGKGPVTANVGLLNVGYRYQARRGFNAWAGVGVQYWQERLRIRFPDYAVDERLTSLMPSATVGLGLRLATHYRIGLENRFLVNPVAGSVGLRNNIALSLGYTF